MKIAKQLLDQRIRKIMEDNPELFSNDEFGRRFSKVFLLLGVASYLDRDVMECEPYITDGANDGGIDAVYYEIVEDYRVNVVLFQGKYVEDLEKESNFPSNAIEKPVATINCIFDPFVAVNLNERSGAAVNEIRSLISDGNIPYVTFVLLNNGLKWNEDGQRIINNAFLDQEQVSFEYWNHNDIIGYINKVKPIEAFLQMRGKAIQEDYNYKRVLMGRMSVRDIASLMMENEDHLLEKNIRRYLGNNSINNAIKSTLLSEKRQNFIFYNNGITMVCDKFSYNALQEKDWKVAVRGLQIINGGQTCRTITQTLSENPSVDYDNVYVLVRLYEVADDEDVISDITFATNSQNPVDFRDLKSNDVFQKQLEQGARDLGYTYKRKRDGFAASTNTIPSTVAAEAVFAIWRGKPHLAKYKRTGFFDSYYNEIFGDLNAAQMVMAVLIFRYSDKIRKRNADDPEIRAFRPYCNYLMANLVGNVLLKENGIEYGGLTHKNFNEIKDYFYDHVDEIISRLEEKIKLFLKDYFGYLKVDSLASIDGRAMAGAFRRYDFIEEVKKRV